MGEKADGFSPTMRAAIDHALKHDATLIRYPGGFWARCGWRQHDGELWFGTSTIEAIVKRGAGEYVKWKDRKCPPNLSTHSCPQFPIEMRVTL